MNLVHSRASVDHALQLFFTLIYVHRKKKTDVSLVITYIQFMKLTVKLIKLMPAMILSNKMNKIRLCDNHSIITIYKYPKGTHKG